ncbi:MAG: PIG-L family deacetylase [Verrucomicrobia bacterium]|nr:MAG: PIG-L family deacetylase [Verrucomicrobiota bacterium]
MNFPRSNVDCFVPDGKSVVDALSRCTHLCIAAHQDDVEILAYPGISHCYDCKDAWFVGVVITDGSGSIREAQHQKLSAEEYSALRRSEQRKAAEVGRYGAMIQLGCSSESVKKHSETLCDDLLEILFLTQPHTLYLHSPADRHETHVAVFLHCLKALRRLAIRNIPKMIYGCEVWGSLDWLPRQRRIALNAGDRLALAAQLLTVFSTQIAGGKRYDIGTMGRRQANATFSDPYAPDPSAGIIWALDLLPLVQNHGLSVEAFVQELVDEFSAEVKKRIRRFS